MDLSDNPIACRYPLPNGPCVRTQGHLGGHRDASYVERDRIRSRDKQRALQALLQEYKLGAGCADCGYCGHHAALLFDHPEGFTRTANVGRLMRYGRERVLAELAKSDVVCANCYTIRTWNRQHP